MLVPVDWLKDYVEFNVSIDELSHSLTMAGLNVENIIRQGENISKVVTGKIVEKKLHPNAERLHICKVDVGKDTILEVITGADNINKGNIVPVALPGAKLPNNNIIKTTNIRGKESQGMMCSLKELGLDPKDYIDKNQEGILILSSDVPLGEDVKKLLGLDSIVLDIEITANRPDCLSIIGIAREIAAILGTDFKYPEIKVPEGKDDINDLIQVKVMDSTLCPRYTARLIDNINIKPSPLWMQQRLRNAGLRPINNIVDITNYVMLEFGQPLHAFDYDYLEGKKIIVRRANKSEKIKTLDGIERTLDEDTLVIADQNKPIGIAGIMGGENSEITANTKKVLLESAAFNYANIRRSSRRLGFRTEASARYEKNLDPTLASLSSKRFAQLVAQTRSGEIVNGVLDSNPKGPETRKVEINADKINKNLGTNISLEKIVNILNSLELYVIQKYKNKLVVEIPSFRKDISQEADISEEIGRVFGFDKIMPTTPKSVATLGKYDDKQIIIDRAKRILNSCGLSEIITYSFMSPKTLTKLNILDNFESCNPISILNPLGEDYSLMRTTLIGNILDAIGRNVNRKVEDIKLFELGTVYKAKQTPLNELPNENKILTIGMVGNVDFYDLKGVIETLLEHFKVGSYNIMEGYHPSFHPGRVASLVIANNRVGVLGEIHPEVAERYEIDERVYISEIEFDHIISSGKHAHNFIPLPKYPPITRDIAIIVNERVLVGDIKETIEREGGELLESVKLFDIYRGDQLPYEHKSLAFALTYRSSKRTLVDKDINDIQNRILKKIKEKYDAELRQ